MDDYNFESQPTAVPVESFDELMVTNEAEYASLVPMETSDASEETNSTGEIAIATNHQQVDRSDHTAIAFVMAFFGLLLQGVNAITQVILHNSQRKMREAIPRGIVDFAILLEERRLFPLTRMTQTAFFTLQEIIRPLIEKQRDLTLGGQVGHNSTFVLLTALTHMAGGQRLLATCKILKIGKATVFKHTDTVVAALKQLAKSHPLFKIASEVEKLSGRSEEFRSVLIRNGASRAPKIIGAVDVTHLPIFTPSVPHPEAYFTVTKKSYTISAQCVVDYNLQFLRVDVGFPGRMNDARIFTETNLNDWIPNGYQLLGDGAYQGSDKIVSPFRLSGQLSRKQLKYNYVISSARSCVERGFGVLKKRWRIIILNEIKDLRKISSLFIACVALHNYCIRSGLKEPDDEVDPTTIEVETDETEAEGIDNQTSYGWRDFYCNMILD